MRTPITLCSASFHLLLLELDILELRPQLIHWSLKYQGVEPPNLKGLSCRPRFECRMTFPVLCLTPTVGCFPELFFLQFSVAQVLVGLRKQFINNFVFPAWDCAAGFNNDKYYHYYTSGSPHSAPHEERRERTNMKRETRVNK